MKYKCFTCGKEFEDRPSNDRKYCGLKCFGIANSSGECNPNWKGGRNSNIKGYISVYSPFHPNRDCRNEVRESRLIVERVLNKILSQRVIIHHFDENKSNNSLNNLVVCQNQNYHNLLHRRARSYYGCGNARWLKCRYCNQYDDPKNLWIDKKNQGRHRECSRIYKRQRRILNANLG